MRINRARLVLSYLSLCLAACDNNGWQPNRPPGLPSTAIYVGGIDGGNWYDCTAEDAQRISCVQFANDGTPEYRKSLRYCANLLFRLKPSYARAARISFIDAGEAKLDQVNLFFDRPWQYLARTGDNQEKLSQEAAISEKYYRDYGVNENCEPNNPVELLLPE